jgi:MFS family permease
MADQCQNDDRSNEETPLLGRFKDEQSMILPRKQLLVVFTALALVQFTSCLDQTCIGTALPAIARDLHAGSSISWVGASFLTSSTSIQLINGRMSDIFGRKSCLVVALTVMGLGNLLSGFSRTPVELYATRAISGISAGALNALVQITVSDITTLEQRGNYFGIIGVFIAIGNGIGPSVGGALIQHTSWRWAFWFICPLTAAAVISIVLVLPQPRVTGDSWVKLKRVDWIGAVVNIIAVLLLLVRLSHKNCSRSCRYLSDHLGLSDSHFARWLHTPMDFACDHRHVVVRHSPIGTICDHRMALCQLADDAK